MMWFTDSFSRRRHRVKARTTAFSLKLIASEIPGIRLGIYRFAPRLQPPGGAESNAGCRTLDVEAGGEMKPPQSTPDLIQQLRSIDWFQFEKLVALVYRRLGYTVTRWGGANPDGGIDLVIEKDDQRSAVQCKQWKTWNAAWLSAPNVSRWH